MMPFCSAIGGINFDHLVKVAACFFIYLHTVTFTDPLTVPFSHFDKGRK